MKPENEPNNSDGKHIDVEQFEKQMRYISLKYNPIPLKYAVEKIRGRLDRPLNAIAITFDDGYRNNLDFAYPIAKKYRIPITIFPNINCTAQKNNANFLHWEDIIALHRGGVDFGSHTVSHPHLTTINEAELFREINNSKKILESRINEEVYSFSYPYGEFNYKVKDLVKQNGFSCALTTEYGINDFNTDLYELKRIPINRNYTFIYFVSSLYPFFHNLTKIFIHKFNG